MELEAGSSTGWMESEEADALIAPLAAAAQRKLPTDLLCSDEAACAQRCAKAFLAVKVSASCCARPTCTCKQKARKQQRSLLVRCGCRCRVPEVLICVLRSIVLLVV